MDFRRAFHVRRFTWIPGISHAGLTKWSTMNETSISSIDFGQICRFEARKISLNPRQKFRDPKSCDRDVFLEINTYGIYSVYYVCVVLRTRGSIILAISCVLASDAIMWRRIAIFEFPFVIHSLCRPFALFDASYRSLSISLSFSFWLSYFDYQFW